MVVQDDLVVVFVAVRAGTVLGDEATRAPTASEELVGEGKPIDGAE